MTQPHAYEDDLKAYLDGELPLLRRMAIARHLARCASCRMEIAQMSQITQELRPEPQETLNPGLRAKILSDLGPASTSPVRAPKKSLRSVALIGAAAAGILAYAFAPQLTPIAHKSMMASSGPAAENQMRLGQAMYSKDNDESYRAPQTFNSLGAPNSQTFDVNGNVKLQVKYPDSHYQDIAKRRSPLTAIAPAHVVSGSIDGNAAVRQVHNEASIGVEVANADTASESLEALVKGVGGYVAESSLSTNGDGKRAAEISVKVPVDQFASVMTQIGKFGKVTAKSVSGEDITEQASDADQAEQIMEDEVRRTDTQLKARGKRATWRDQEQARDLRIQLAQSRARLQLLKKMARLSDIDVTLTEKSKDTPKAVTSTFWTNLTASTGAATDSLASAFGRVLALVIWIIAYAPLWVPALLAYRWWARKQAKAQA